MESLKLIATIALAALVHFIGVRLWPDFVRAVDVFLVVVALHGLRGNSLSGLLVGLLVGLLQDTLTSGPFGLFGFADTIIGYITARLAQRLVIQRPTGVLALVSFAAVLQQAITVGLAFLLLPAPETPSPVWAVIRAGACGVLGMAIYIVAGRWRNSSETRRRGRMSRLRLG
ncbi:MAG TPA: rod shape-determining protein MreD [Thermoanaerobaculia bacterium]|nr:rod shape-determining protein MreD [Thermoanaerobaculia bacterium]